MKELKHYINEAFKINKNTKLEKYNYFPKTKGELNSIIRERIKNEGNECDLNDIDVSEITDMSSLFTWSRFNGDISRWDVSNVISMTNLFNSSYFNGDISNWNVSSVEDMKHMFAFAEKFNGDISKWDISKVKNMEGMFRDSKFNQDISNWDVSNVKNTHDMFYNCPIEEKYKPNGVK